MSYDDAIEDIQTRLSFQEDTIHALNLQVATQQQTIEMLQKQLQHVYKKMKTLEGTVGGIEDDDVPPPHY